MEVWIAETAVGGSEKVMGVMAGRAERGEGVGDPRGILFSASERRSQSLSREVGVPSMQECCESIL